MDSSLRDPTATTRYPVAISRALGPLFHLFGFRRAASWIDVDAEGIRIRFGTADERIPLAQIRAVGPAARWPFYFGLGAKFGPEGTVAYAGSRSGLIRIDFVTPRKMNVWGPLDASAATGVIVSLEDADRFVANVTAALG